VDELFAEVGGSPGAGRLRRWPRLPTGYRLRDAREADAPALHALHCAVLEEGRWFAADPDELPPTPAWHAQRIRAAGSDPTARSRVLVVHQDDLLAGALLLEAEPGRRRRHLARLEVFLHRAHRGRGLGAALLDAAVEHGRAHPELRKISLAVFADNTAAVGLYRSRGFVEEGRRKGEYLEPDGRARDDLLMARMV
jgi:ribosomal protein S18 acetylase RimI-like enzyme